VFDIGRRAESIDPAYLCGTVDFTATAVGLSAVQHRACMKRPLREKEFEFSETGVVLRCTVRREQAVRRSPCNTERALGDAEHLAVVYPAVRAARI